MTRTSTNQVGNAPYYGAIAFGSGYLVVFLGLLIGFCEVSARDLQGMIVTVDTGLMNVFIFLYAVCGIWLGISIVRTAQSVRASGNSELSQLSSTLTAFSLILLFLGLADIMYIRAKATSDSLDISILFVVSAVLLLVGFRIYREKTTESRFMGAILVLISTVLLYFFAYPSLNRPNVLNYFGYAYSSSSGPLFSQLNVERVALPLAAFCAILYVVPSVQRGSRRFAVDATVALSVVILSVGLMYYNFPAASNLLRTTSLSNGSVLSPWIIAFGLLALAISGIIILISALLAMVSFYNSRNSLLARTRLTNRCSRCGFENMKDSNFCGKCGIPLKDETIPY